MTDCILRFNICHQVADNSLRSFEKNYIRIFFIDFFCQESTDFVKHSLHFRVHFSFSEYRRCLGFCQTFGTLPSAYSCCVTTPLISASSASFSCAAAFASFEVSQ